MQQPDQPASPTRARIGCHLTPFAYRSSGWMLGKQGGLLQDERLRVRSTWSGERLEVVCSGGEAKVWGNELRLTFSLEDPLRPAVEAEFSWFSDVGPREANLRSLSGDVFVVPLDETKELWARVKDGWNGRAKVQIGFELHGEHEGAPLCAHGVFELEPSEKK